MQKWRQSGVVLLPTLFLGRLYTRGLCITAQPEGPLRLKPNLVILFLAVWLLLEKQSFIYPTEKKEITGTCLLWTSDQNHRIHNLWNRKVNAFLPVHWGNWGPEIGRERDKVTVLVNGGSTSILIGWDIETSLSCTCLHPLKDWFAWTYQNKWKQISFLDLESFVWRHFSSSPSAWGTRCSFGQTADPLEARGPNSGLQWICGRMGESGL